MNEPYHHHCLFLRPLTLCFSYVIPRYIGGSTSDLDTNRIHHALPKWLGGSWLMNLKVKIEDWVFGRYVTADRYLCCCCLIDCCCLLSHILLQSMAHPDDDFELLEAAAEFNKKRGMPWQRRYGTKNTSFIEVTLNALCCVWLPVFSFFFLFCLNPP